MNLDKLTDEKKPFFLSLLKKLGFAAIVIAIGLSLISLFIVYAFWTGENPSKVYWHYSVSNQNEVLHFNCFGFGVTGDHRIIKISPRKDDKMMRKENEYFLDSYCYVGYRFYSDTLFVYSDIHFSPPAKNQFKIPVAFRAAKFGKGISGVKTISPYGDE